MVSNAKNLSSAGIFYESEDSFGLCPKRYGYSGQDVTGQRRTSFADLQEHSRQRLRIAFNGVCLVMLLPPFQVLLQAFIKKITKSVN